MNPSSSIIERLKQKPIAKQKREITVGIKAAPREEVKIDATINDRRKEGLISDRDEILKRFRGADQAVVKQVAPTAEQPVSRRPPPPPSDTRQTDKPRKSLSRKGVKARKLKGKIKIVGIDKGTISTATPVADRAKKSRRRLTKQPKLSIISEDIPEDQVVEGVLIDPNRLPKETPKVLVKASTYYLNNREIFMNFINSLFTGYRDELLDDAANVSCESRQAGGEFSLLTHQRIVRDYLNLYTPYRGLLLYHGLGSGKTCSSIAIAEGMKTAKNVVIMTPASLKRNYIEELKKCGDTLYKKNQNWEFISITETTSGTAALIDELSAVLSLSKEWIVKNRGAWLVDIRKPANFENLSVDDKENLDVQLNEMIRDKYQFINYNGLRNDHLDMLSNQGNINPFDNKVVIVDEAHNFVSRIVNKMGRPEALSQRLYEYLMLAENCRIVLLTGTPIINYPNEIAVLFNMLRGYIKTWTIPINIKTEMRVNQDEIRKIIASSATLNGIIDFVEYTPSSKQIIFTRNPFGFVNVHQGRRYDGVRIREEHGNVDERGNITDDAMLAKLVSVMGRANIELIMSGMRVDVYKALPDAKDQFINNFIDTTTGELKNAELLQRRIIGLTSYFKSAQEALMPAFDRDTNVHVIRLDMSSYQFGKYEEARVSERKQEKNKPKKKKRQGGTGDVFDDSVSTYRIFSRAFCNFVFPPTIERPMPGNDSLEDVIANPSADEDIIDAASIKERMNNIDGRYTEDDRKNMTQDSSYNARIVNALSELQDNANEFLTPEGVDGSGGLTIYSPKFLAMLENIQSSDFMGLHLIYSQFRTIEGIGVFKLVLEANGFTQFKIKKDGGLWSIDISEENRGKPTFALYTGTEDAEEKEIIRNIYNGAWEYIPINIRTELERISSNNNMGEIIKVFMITSSGAEGISLRNTRYVHIVEPYWHPVRMEQVIGRARRICSHEDLPEELRTVEVFLYLMTLSEEQRNSEESVELRLKDKSKLSDAPLTSDEALFEIANIKEDINKKILMTVKQSAMDCNLHSRADAKEPVVCYSFGNPSQDRYSYYPALEREERDVVAKINRKKVTWKAKEVTINGKKYAYKKETGEVYDLDSYKQAIRVSGAEPLLKGRLEKDARGKLKFTEL